jgi:hypothetical protein
MIRAGNALGWNDLAGKRPEAPFHAVTHDGAADLLGDREADSHRSIRILPISDEQDEPGGSRALAGVCRDEVGALLDRD